MSASLDIHSVDLANKLLGNDVDQRSNHTTRRAYRASHERRVIRKADWRLLPLLCLVYLCCFLDRSNI
ncbi:hypothetical protein H4R34_006426, partial [Dimargaris verticillata]